MTPTASRRAGRLWSKALRVLDSRAPRRFESPSDGEDLLAMRKELESRLAEYKVSFHLRRTLSAHRRPVAITTVVSVLFAAMLVVVIPTFRNWFFPPDRAVGKPWTATSAFEGWVTAGLLVNDANGPLMFHTTVEPSPAVTIDLQAQLPITNVSVGNRLDCCRERAVPLAVEVSSDGRTWKRVGYRRMEFRTWDATFPPTRSRFVRLRVDRPSILHLQTISVY
jgi:hypothetical protein